MGWVLICSQLFIVSIVNVYCLFLFLSAGQPFCGVKFVSLRSGDEVHSTSFKTLQVHGIEANKTWVQSAKAVVKGNQATDMSPGRKRLHPLMLGLIKVWWRTPMWLNRFSVSLLYDQPGPFSEWEFTEWKWLWIARPVLHSKEQCVLSSRKLRSATQTSGTR